VDAIDFYIAAIERLSRDVSRTACAYFISLYTQQLLFYHTCITKILKKAA